MKSFIKTLWDLEAEGKFLGHGIGLQVDEMPVIAEGFNEPLKEGMVLA